MSLVVVDTNVGIAANGDADVDPACQRACVDMLEDAMKNRIVAVDDGGRIFQEYQSRFRFVGGPGLGDVFFKHVHDLQHRGERVRRFPITPSADESRGFEELPKNTFDPSDRKFLAVAVVAKAAVVNATDSDWGKARDLMGELGVEVEELCPHLPKIHASYAGAGAS